MNVGNRSTVTRLVRDRLAKNREWQSKHGLKAIEPEPDRVVLFRTTEGDLRMRLYSQPEASPALSKAFVDRVCAGVYDGTTLFARRDDLNESLGPRRRRPHEAAGHDARSRRRDRHDDLGRPVARRADAAGARALARPAREGRRLRVARRRGVHGRRVAVPDLREGLDRARLRLHAVRQARRRQHRGARAHPRAQDRRRGEPRGPRRPQEGEDRGASRRAPSRS